MKWGLSHPRGRRGPAATCFMFSGGSGEGSGIPRLYIPQYANPPPPPCPIGYGQCLFGVKTLLILEKGQ